ncbi:oligopeptide transport system ATP-binding protein [Proteiniborus ethanoligenes]|uniref:Oligopeptide transport system ATP-binding protein n=1 Tax=Proteiniborus ethanoligenes TaxID=415015 RepID=A0A1H3RAP6_9FIRM|nr:ABC transporter ATP-binding protein [Proteiniborus ethanoligenes]SDZ22720.1 oligopeptide transport system ATP-binding protein [Proteiniborus ethanoligenes]
MKKILEVKDLHVSFNTHNGIVKAIRGVSFDLYKGETLAIVGESGSGKSVTTKVLMGILAKNEVIEKGEILFEGKDLTKISNKEITNIRGKEIAMIFQDPMTSLNPTMTVGYQIAESIMEHQKLSKSQAKEKAIELIQLVGINEPEKRYKQYPHQLSGGMRQRIVIAIALACNPKILIADEPTTALDVTIQAQILDLIKEIQNKIGLSIIFITHDLGVVANIADRVAIMYAGKIIEYGTSEEIFYHPQHPYTWGLLASVPDMANQQNELYAIPGTPPNMLYPPKGDAFALRSDYALKIDFEEEPPFFKVSDTHYAATWLLHEKAPKIQMPKVLKDRIEMMKKEVALNAC